MQRSILVLVAVLVLVIIFAWRYNALEGGLFSSSFIPQATVYIDNTPISVELARTQEEIVRGLSGRPSLPSEKGMLFIFEEPGYYEFWMKDMRFPIDIIWISEDLQVVDIAPDVGPETYPNTFQPNDLAQYVLEVNALYTEVHGIKIGDPVRFSDNISN